MVPLPWPIAENGRSPRCPERKHFPRNLRKAFLETQRAHSRCLMMMRNKVWLLLSAVVGLACSDKAEVLTPGVGGSAGARCSNGSCENGGTCQDVDGEARCTCTSGAL
jgi:hypothetical protein